MLDTLSLIGDRIIAYRPILRAMGISSTVNGTLLASQLLYLFQQAGRQPFAVTDIELASQTALSVDEVRAARADLIKRLGPESYFRYDLKGMPRQGWYDVDADRINNIFTQGQCAVMNQGPQNPSSCQFGPGAEQVRATTRTSAGHSPNKFGPGAELSISKNLLEELRQREEEPPLSPVEQIATRPPAAPSEGSAPREPKDPYATRKLPVELIPSDLLDAQELLREFWAGKKGARTERVFGRVCEKLRLWTPEGRRESLVTAIASKYGDVFPPRSGGLLLGNGSSRRTQPSRVQPKDEFVAGILAMEATGLFDTPRTA